MIFRSDLINCIFLLIYHISLFMNSRRMLANSRSFAQNSRSFQGKKAHFRIQGVFQDKTQIQGVFKACANPVKTNVSRILRTSPVILFQLLGPWYANVR